MKIGILGTGHVARLLAPAWARAGHEITLGSRDPDSKRLDFPVTTLAETVQWADVVVNATPGATSLATLSTIDLSQFAGKTLIDVGNAFTPAFALVYPNSSLAEHLQAALPSARVVKSLNTGAMTLMADPRRIGPSSVFLSGILRRWTRFLGARTSWRSRDRQRHRRRKDEGWKARDALRLHRLNL